MAGRRILANGWAAKDSSGNLSPYSFHLREADADDILLKVLYCGVDHTDLHQVKGELISTPSYPLVPGHEVVGEVIEVGSKVKDFKEGDIVGVGGIIGSCGECSLCNSNLEHYCNDRIWTYNHFHKDGTPTQGGFSSSMLVHQRFAVKIPNNLAPEQAAPLLCAGVTAYSPLKQFMNNSSDINNKAINIKGGILGLGGVGHLAVIIAKAMGHHVTVISSSDKKRDEAIQDLNADAFVVSNDEAEMKKVANSLDYILDTLPVFHRVESYLSLLKVEGKLLVVGAAPQPLQFLAGDMIQGKKAIMGSLMGSVKDMQELVNFWVEKGLKSMIEVVKMDYINKAFERMERNDVRYRFVVDVAGSNFK